MEILRASPGKFCIGIILLGQNYLYKEVDTEIEAYNKVRDLNRFRRRRRDSKFYFVNENLKSFIPSIELKPESEETQRRRLRIKMVVEDTLLCMKRTESISR